MPHASRPDAETVASPRVVEWLSRQVPIRREKGGDDLFSELCRARMEDGRLMSTQAVVDHMSFMMFAVHDTLTSSFTSLVYRLAGTPALHDVLPVSAGLPEQDRDAYTPASASVDVFDFQGHPGTAQVTAKGYDTMTGTGSRQGASGNSTIPARSPFLTVAPSSTCGSNRPAS